MAKQVKTVELTHPNGSKVTVASASVDTLLSQGFKQAGGKQRQAPKSA